MLRRCISAHQIGDHAHCHVPQHDCISTACERVPETNPQCTTLRTGGPHILALCNMWAHLKLDQYTAPSPTVVSPPPYSCTLVRALKPESGPGSTSAILPSGDLRVKGHSSSFAG